MGLAVTLQVMMALRVQIRLHHFLWQNLKKVTFLMIKQG